MDYYSPLWGPKAISMVVELQGALTCRSSTITVWADSSPFLGLLLYFWVTELFPLLMNPGGVFRCRSSTLTILANTGPLRGLLLTVLGSQSDFPGCQTPKMCLRVGRQDS